MTRWRGAVKPTLLESLFSALPGLDLPEFVQLFGEFCDEAGGLLHDVSIPGLVPDEGIGQVKFVLGAGDGDVEKAALFLQGAKAAVINGAAVGKHAVR